jgi:putative transposase
MKLDDNNHSVFKLYYHLIMSTKYRRKVIDDEISDFLKMKFSSIGRNYHITLEEFNHDQDHIHILFRANPNSDLSKFINAYKSATSRLVKKDFPSVKAKLWREMFWTRSYCLLTSGGVTIDIVRQYIETQGEK